MCALTRQVRKSDIYKYILYLWACPATVRFKVCGLRPEHCQIYKSRDSNKPAGVSCVERVDTRRTQTWRWTGRGDSRQLAFLAPHRVYSYFFSTTVPHFSFVHGCEKARLSIEHRYLLYHLTPVTANDLPSITPGIIFPSRRSKIRAGAAAAVQSYSGTMLFFFRAEANMFGVSDLRASSLQLCIPTAGSMTDWMGYGQLLSHSRFRIGSFMCVSYRLFWVQQYTFRYEVGEPPRGSNTHTNTFFFSTHHR